MRIKKKYVLLESLVIDLTNEFNENEKRILKLIHKKYKHEPYTSNVWEVAAWLIEDFNLSYEDAFSLAKTYYWENNRLFKEHESLRKNWPIPEIIFAKLGDFITSVVKKFPEDIYGNIVVKFDGDSGFIDERVVRIWAAYKSIALYIPFQYFRIINGQYDYRYLETNERDDRMLRVDINFFQLDNDGNKIEKDLWRTEDYEKNLVNLNEYLVDVVYRVGNEDKNYIPLMSFNVPYPKTVTIDTITKDFNGIIEDVIQKIKNTTFKLPSGAEPIVVNAGSRLD
jgi:hypothetical protein